MRQACLLLTALLLSAAPAQAQVTVDLQALDKLPGAHARGQASGAPRSQSHGRPSGSATAKPRSRVATGGREARRRSRRRRPHRRRPRRHSVDAAAAAGHAADRTAGHRRPGAGAATAASRATGSAAAAAADLGQRGERGNRPRARGCASPSAPGRPISARPVPRPSRTSCSQRRPATAPASTSWPMPRARRRIPRRPGAFRCRAPWRCAAR